MSFFGGYDGYGGNNCGYGYGPVAGSNQGCGNGFAIIVVLFILLIIIGAACYC